MNLFSHILVVKGPKCLYTIIPSGFIKKDSGAP